MSRDVSTQSDISKSKFHGADGSFQRAPSSFRHTLAPEQAASGRYHLYVSYACPWATRALIVRKLKGLDAHIGVTVVSPRMGEHGWPLGDTDPFPGAEPDPHEGAKHVKDLYLKAAPDYSGRFTVPVLWDTQEKTIVNNESSEIIRIFNTAFNAILAPEHAKIDLYPEHLRAQIDEVNEWVYTDVNNGVYRSGFAATQDAYETAVTKLFAALDKLEGMVQGKKYLIGDQLTEADVRLFVTLIRFDPVYAGHFKCNLRTIRAGYPALHAWMLNLYWNDVAFRSTTNFEHIKVHYYWSHPHDAHRARGACAEHRAALGEPRGECTLCTSMNQAQDRVSKRNAVHRSGSIPRLPLLPPLADSQPTANPFRHLFSCTIGVENASGSIFNAFSAILAFSNAFEPLKSG